MSDGTVWRIAVWPGSEELDVRGRGLLADVHGLGLAHVRCIRSARLYFLHGDLKIDDADRLARTLLCDAVSEVCRCAVDTPDLGWVDAADPGSAIIEVHTRAGVMDPVAQSALEAIRQSLAAGRGGGRPRVESVRTAWRYTIDGASDADELDRIAREILSNECIQHVYIKGFGRDDRRPVGPPQAPLRPFELRRVAIRELDGPALDALSRGAHLFLSRLEMETIRDRFRALERDPTDLELETLAQTWSEHCVHKTLNSAVSYCGEDFGRNGTVEAHFDNLFRATIARATTELNRDWCLSVFSDNAGIIAFDEEYGVAFKVETHNHPSAIEPYGGAATGIGGCIRDIMGCGLGARPIASTDVFCVAPPDYPGERLPRGVLHPARVLKGVVGGVRDYGNRMGIPTVNGAVIFDARYLANPLVFCGCVGLIPRDRIAKEPLGGDRIVLLGGRTGRDGIHGATFSSAELTEQHADEFSHAVQIGNPIEEKKLLDALLQARDHETGCLYSTITDCGAGGLSSAVGEMGARLGAAVELEKVPLKYSGLRYDEIWISEAQERMVLAVPPERLDALLAVCATEDVEASVIGSFTGDGRLTVRYRGTVVGDLEMGFLHEGLPKATREARWTAPHPNSQRKREAYPGGKRRPVDGPVACAPGSDQRAYVPGSDQCGTADAGLTRALLDRVGSYNVASKEWIIRQYDHEVQGGSVIKPLCGPGEGPGDAAVLRPLPDRWSGIALGCGLCPDVADDDPYWMAIRAVDEALRNVICVGADPARVAILDNFCWGGCDTPAAMGALVRACRGASDAAVAFGLPFISGKDSLNNQFLLDPVEAVRLGLPETITIPGTLLISAIGIIEDVRRCVTPDLKRAGNVLTLVAPPADGVGGPRDAGRHGSGPPQETLAGAFDAHLRVAEAIRGGDVAAAHDVSDGGLAVALAEMCMAGGLGACIELDDAPGDTPAAELFDEYAAAYVLECGPDEDLARIGGARLGTVTEIPRLVITAGGETLIDIDVAALTAAWREPLSRTLGGQA